MADNKQNVGEPDRSRVSGSEDYEVDYFARKHGISPAQARDLIREHGSNRSSREHVSVTKAGRAERERLQLWQAWTRRCSNARV